MSGRVGSHRPHLLRALLRCSSHILAVESSHGLLHLSQQLFFDHVVVGVADLAAVVRFRQIGELPTDRGVVRELALGLVGQPVGDPHDTRNGREWQQRQSAKKSHVLSPHATKEYAGIGPAYSICSRLPSSSCSCATAASSSLSRSGSMSSATEATTGGSTASASTSSASGAIPSSTRCPSRLLSASTAAETRSPSATRSDQSAEPRHRSTCRRSWSCDVTAVWTAASSSRTALTVIWTRPPSRSSSSRKCAADRFSTGGSAGSSSTMVPNRNGSTSPAASACSSTVR